MKRTFLGLLGLLLAWGTVSAQVTAFQPTFSKGAPYAIEIYPVSEMIVREGAFPYQIDIVNRSGESAKFTVTADYSARHGGSGNIETTRRQTFEVPAGTRQLFHSEILISDFSRNSWASPNISFSVTGPGIQNRYAGDVYDNRNYSQSKDPLYIAFIGPLHGQIGASLSSGKGMQVEAGRMDPNFLPIRSSGYNGWDLVAIRAKEWIQLSVESRTALLDWVHLGGYLLLDTQGATEIEKLYLKNEYGLTDRKRVSRLGFGALYQFGSRGVNQWTSWLGKNIQNKSNQNLGRDPNWLGESWEDLIADNAIAIHAVLISLFMIAFAIVIGPINLMKLAPANRRFRIFITTPIISAAASLILIVVIVVGDGFGGDMYHGTLAYLDSKDGKYYVDQRGIVRSSLLFNTDFEVSSGRHVSPLIVRNNDRQASKRFVHNAGVLGGDFLKNRSWQGLRVEHVEPTRSEIQVTRTQDGSGFEVYSSVSASIDQLLFIDKSGKAWLAKGLGQGGRKPLELVEKNEANDFWLQIEDNTNRGQFRQARRWSRQSRGAFVAITDGIQELPIIELPAIRKQAGIAVICGLVDVKEAAQ